jgi:hypothetical protein
MNKNEDINENKNVNQKENKLAISGNRACDNSHRRGGLYPLGHLGG